MLWVGLPVSGPLGGSLRQRYEDNRNLVLTAEYILTMPAKLDIYV